MTAVSSSSAGASSSLSNGPPATTISPTRSNGHSSSSPTQLTPTSSNHWSQKKHESVIDVSQLSQLELEKYLLSKLNGGSDNGQFVYYNNAQDNAQSMKSVNLKYLTASRILDGEILLEVEDNRVSGYTLYDVVDLVLKLYRTQKSIRFR